MAEYEREREREAGEEYACVYIEAWFSRWGGRDFLPQWKPEQSQAGGVKGGRVKQTRRGWERLKRGGCGGRLRDRPLKAFDPPFVRGSAFLLENVSADGTISTLDLFVLLTFMPASSLFLFFFFYFPE